ncbi:MAG: cation diffusion facilitator family transporter [Treponema sp.]
MNEVAQNTPAQATRIKIVRQASFIALFGNLVLCAAKLIAGFLTGSLAVIGDGLDSAADVGIAVMAVAVSFIIDRPSDQKHPWGHQRAETIASLILAFLIMFAGIQLCIAAINRLIGVYHGLTLSMPERAAIIVTGASIAGKLLLAVNQHILGKKAESLMISANARNMLNDIVLSCAVLTGFALSALFSLPILDTVIALFVSCWIMKSAFTLSIELNVELMDGNTNKKLYEQLFNAVQTVPAAKNPHRARIRKMANLWDIDLDIEVDGQLTVYEAHNIAEQITREIKERISNVYDVMIHVEPYNSDRSEESYGLSQKDIGHGDAAVLI